MAAIKTPRAFKLYPWILGISLFVASVLASEVQQIPRQALGNITSDIFYFEDKDSSLNINQILSNDTQSHFQRNDRSELFIQSNTLSTYWLRVTVKPEEIGITENQDLFLHIPQHPNLLADVTFFDPLSPNEIRTVETGRMKPWQSRDVNADEYIFTFKVTPKQSKTVFLKVSNREMSIPISMALYLRNNVMMQESLLSTTAIKWSFYTVMSAFFIYNFFLLAALRDQIYFLYASVILCQMVLAASIDGTFFSLFWPNNPAFDMQVGIFTGIIVNLFRLKYIYNTLTFTNRGHFEYAYRVVFYIGFFFIGIITLGYTFIGHSSLFLQISQFYAILCVALQLALIIKGIIKKDLAAIILFFAEIYVIAGVSIFMLRMNGTVAHTDFTYWSLHTGYACEAILFALAIASRMNKLQKEKNHLKSIALIEVQQKNKEKTDFLNTISHELCTPMNGIIGNLGLIHSTDVSVQAAPFLKDIQTSSEELMQQIERILQFAELNAGKSEVQVQTFDLHHLIKSRQNKALSSCRAKSLTLEVNIGDGVPKQCDGDGPKLSLILDNLIENAIEFTSRGRVTLDVGIDSQEDEKTIVKFSVTDTGCGIAEDKLSYIFEAFSQADASFNRQHSGIGLGLALCQEYVQLMDGTITVTSVVNIGSRFHVLLPLTRRNADVISSPILAAPPLTNETHKNNNATVLIVEDNIVNQKLLSALVNKLGYKTDIVENGRAAVEYLSDKRVDLVFMDCQMPVMDGFEATREIRNGNTLDPKVPIIAVTANVMSGDRQRCLDAGMDDYIKKPIHKNLIQEALAKYIT